MATSKNLKDVILVHCQEVPETICVETRFISQSGKQHNIDQKFCSNIGSSELNKDPQFINNANPVTSNIIPTHVTNTSVQQYELSLPVSLPNHSNENTFKTFNVEMSSFSNIVDTSNEQTQQTDISGFHTKSIAIQCKLDDEIEDSDVEWPSISNNFGEHEENEMESFLKFIKENSTQHKNYKECLICGELCKSNKFFYGHMAVHRGPKALCYKCGQYLEHENLLHQHKCQKDKQLAKAFLRCPNFACDVAAISVLELYDHINEHTSNGIYKCSACRKSFCTGQEFLRHILIRAKCYTNAKRKRFRVYGLETQRDRKCRVRVFTLHTYKKSTILVKTFLSQRAQKKGFCKICFKSLSNKLVYKRHRQKCIALFKKRLQKYKNKGK